jgi:hypothetical protein
MFMELDMVAGHFRDFRDCLPNDPKYARVVGRYFPLLWDGSNSWFTVDLEPANHSRIVLLHTELGGILFEAYGSFEEFLRDTIRANEQNEPLAAFDNLKPVI